MRLSPQSCQNVGKKFSLRFFQLAGPEELCLHPAKMPQKVFVALFFSWRELEEMCGRLWAWNEHLRVSAGVADPRFQFSAIHSDTRVTNKASAKISHGTLSSET